MAQADHDAPLARRDPDTATRTAWQDANLPLAAHWHDHTTTSLPVVRDAGFTEIAPGSAP